MNIKLIAGLSTLLIGVSACTTTPAPTGDTNITTLTTAELYRATVNAQAARKNVDVRWVNAPDDDDLKKYSKDQAAKGKAEL